MSGWWLLLAVAGGWYGSYRYSNWAIKKCLRSPGLTERALSTMKQKNLLKLRDYVVAEVEKRRDETIGVK